MNFFAYLDPGTGTLIVQAVLGGAAGVAVLFKTMGNRFKRTEPAEATSTFDSDESDQTLTTPNQD